MNPSPSRSVVLLPADVPRWAPCDVFPLCGSDLLPAGQWSTPRTYTPRADECFGLPTGPRNGVFVVDEDEKGGRSGRASLLAYIAKHDLPPLPETRTIGTKSAGRHLYFLYPADGTVIGNRAGVLPSLDIRGAGGFVRSGGPLYPVLDPRDPVQAPAWLVALVSSKARSATALDAATDLRSVSRDDPFWPVLVHEAEHCAATEPPCISGEGGHTRLLKFTQHVRQHLGLPRDEARRILDIFNSRCVPEWSDAELEHKLDDTNKPYFHEDDVNRTGWGWHAGQEPGSFFWMLKSPKNAANDTLAHDPLFARLHDQSAEDAPSMPERVTVLLSDKDFYLTVDAACAAIGNHTDVYQRNGELVRLVRISEAEVKTDADRRVDGRSPMVVGTPTIRKVSRDALLPLLSSVAIFGRKVRKPVAVPDEEGKMHETIQEYTRHMKPEKDLVAAVHVAGQWPGTRALKGIVETPLMRPDGTILQTPGHDPATGYLYSPGATRFPLIPDNPTREDARQALAALQEVFCDFPYVDEPSRAVTIAALLTVLARCGIAGNVPAFILEAAMRGSGKSLQALIIAIIATGRPISLFSFPESQEELAKVVTSISRRALSLFSFDNVPKGLQFGGAIIDAALTCNGKLSSRTLGQSEAPDYAWLAVMLVTGNNLALRGDIFRRAFNCRLDPAPADAQYRHPDLAAWVLAERPRLVVAALTLLRAYVVAGRPDPVKRVASFEAWSALIPSAIVWAGGADATLSVPESDADEASDTTNNLIAAWPEGQFFNAAQLITMSHGGQLASEGQPFFNQPGAQTEYGTFTAALKAFIDEPFPNVMAVGRKLRGAKGVVFAGKKLAVRQVDRHWTVVPARK